MVGKSAVLCFLLAAAGPPLSNFERVSTKPLLAPLGDGWESAGVFNPAVVQTGKGEYAMLYRAQDRAGISRLGYAASTDGVSFARRPDPVFSPETDYERGGGIEDPRLIKSRGTYYLTYTAYNKKDAQLCLATSKDLLHWERQGILFPAYKGLWNKGWTKSGAILAEAIEGKHYMYFMGDAQDHPGQMGIAFSTDLVHWHEALDKPVLTTRPGMFDSKVVEPGPPPILTLAGILLVYNGADDNLIYRTGWVLFDRHNPMKVVARSDQAIFAPSQDWEKTGQVPNVVFVEGMLRLPRRWLFYYGAADKYVGVASGILTERMP